ncbi:hypothetical protein QFZ77_005413 [Paenibacillus sp. V4I3]|uniref:hypothetical protein n=1 Tax=Paenibacillus sp. V4I3 TaxID=3042305 RepID=UPI00277D6E4C|nr:hypothetical protein [Paenibacillus sp. V4I3]MDQ0876754.1 hypothetical protein [Paenibacillus sp. V4I3]
MITVDKIIKHLSDKFTKDPSSNIGKLLSIMADQLRDVEETFERIRDWRDIDIAEGTTLDKIGTIVNQSRGAATDEVYRILIKSKIARNLSTGDINTIIGVLSTALDCEPSEIEIKELYTDPVDPEPATISLIKLPLQSVNEAGMSPIQFARIIQQTVAAGVRVGAIEMTGTFQFASGSTTETSSTEGFSNDVGTTGGYFGAVYTPGDDPDLPI